MKNTVIKSIWVTLAIVLFFLFSCAPTQQVEIMSKDENLIEGYKIMQRTKLLAKEGDVYSLTLNSDGKRLAYLWRGKRRSSVWIGDKKVSPDFGNITELIAFCPDGSKVAYAAEARLNNMSLWVNNNKISPEFSEIFNVVFSPDCSTVAYRAIAHRDVEPGKAMGKNSIWINGTRMSPEGCNVYPRWPVFSPDGSKVAYIVEVGKKWSVWINDKRVSPEFDMIGGDLTFSPDGSSVAYTVRHDKIPSIWVDGKRQFDNAIGPVFSPDGSKIAYRRVEGGKWSVYINDKKVSPELGFASSLAFSSDGSKVAYSAGGDKENQYVWINDKRVSPEFSPFLLGDLVFSPDGSSVAYRVLYREKNGFVQSIWINDKRVSPEFRNVEFAKEHFSKTGEVIFAGFDAEKREILHAMPVGTR